MLSDLQLVYIYMAPRNSTQLLNINTTKFQVEREPVYYMGGLFAVFFSILGSFLLCFSPYGGPFHHVVLWRHFCYFFLYVGDHFCFMRPFWDCSPYKNFCGRPLLYGAWRHKASFPLSQKIILTPTK